MPIQPTETAPIPRHAEAPLRIGLADTRIVAPVGPRQSGKTTLRRVTEADIKEDRSKLGALLEGFVFSELTKLVGHSDDRITISHLRDRDKVEVDFVLEKAGRIVGLEVKAAASVKPDDFHGLKRLQEATGKAFACGIILHDGERIQRTGDRLFAMSVQQLWA